MLEIKFLFTIHIPGKEILHNGEILNRIGKMMYMMQAQN